MPGSFLWLNKEAPVTGEKRGTGWLDGGAPWYDTYETKDGLFMAVGAIEPQFYSELLKGKSVVFPIHNSASVCNDQKHKLWKCCYKHSVSRIIITELMLMFLALNLDPDENPQFGDWPGLRKRFTEVFKTKTQREWEEVFESCDACVTPVVLAENAAQYEHNKVTESFINTTDGTSIPKPAPALSRSPATCTPSQSLSPGLHTTEVLKEFGFSENEIKQLLAAGIVSHQQLQAKL